MRKLVLTVLVLSLIAGTSWAAAPDLTFGDFMPIVQAPSDQRDALREVKDSDAVTTETREITVNGETVTLATIKGKTLQDAANDFLKRRGEMGASRIEDTNGNGSYIATRYRHL